VRIDCGVASISLFRIDVPPSSESIWFGTRTTKMEPNDKVELRKILRPPCLSLGQYFGSRKILRKDIRKVRSLYKFCRVDLNVQKAKTKLKLTRA